MKEKISAYLDKIKKFILRGFEILLVKSEPLQKKYKQYSSTKYGKLIRMDSYHVYPILFLPTWCAIWMADKSGDLMPRILLCLFFAIGAFLMRSIGCIVNDIADIKFDRQVNRTKNRPLAAGEVKISEAANFATILSMLAVVVLLSLPRNAIFVGMIAALMTLLYPFAKRFTHLAQLVLGFTFNTGVLIGWLSVNNGQYFQLSMLYIGFAMFTFAYDTIYACQDLEDDLKVGVKSFPVMLRNKNRDVKLIVWQIYKLSMICIGIAGLGMNLNSSFYFGLAGASYMLYNAFESCDIDNASSCAEHFRKSTIFLFILFLGTVFGT